MGHRAGLDGRKISSPPGFDPGSSSPLSVAIPTELSGPQKAINYLGKDMINSGKLGYSTCKRSLLVKKRVTGKVMYRRQKPITL